MKNSLLKLNLSIGLGAALLLIPFLGRVHLFDWDEINFAECAREMLVTHDFFTVRINFLPFWEKPPLFIWLSAGCMELFGVNEFAARLPDALCGIGTLLLVFNIGNRLYDKKMGLLWVLSYAGSTLPQFYFKSGIIDPWFNLFIFCGIYLFVLFTNTPAESANTESSKERLILLIKSAFFIGLAVLTKGPVAILILGLCVLVYLLIKRFRNVISFGQLIVYGAVVLSLGGIWFLILWLSGNSAVITEFFQYQVRLFQTQDSGHGGPFYYHFIVLLVGCFPASAFAIWGMKKNTADTLFQRHFRRWMLILFWVVLLLFSIVNTKIIHYSSLCYFPLTYFSARCMHGILNGTQAWKKGISILIGIIGGLFGLVLLCLPLVDRFKSRLLASNLIDDAFAVENLKAQVHWSGWEGLIGAGSLVALIVCLGMAHKKRTFTAVGILFVTNLFVVELSSLVIAPKIEQYVQGAAIEFYQELRGKDCYLETITFKSYAQYFYGEIRPTKNNKSYLPDWLLDGPIDRPAYFSAKITETETIRKLHPLLKELYRKNGFVFYRREPSPFNIQ